jgi:NAD(P) transhydrogenase
VLLRCGCLETHLEGATERELTARRVPHEVGHSAFKSLAHTQIVGQTIMAQPPPGNTLRYFIGTTFNYPTMAEAYRMAALHGMNRLC